MRTYKKPLRHTGTVTGDKCNDPQCWCDPYPEYRVHPRLDDSLWTLGSLHDDDRKQFFKVCARLYSLKTGRNRKRK